MTDVDFEPTTLDISKMKSIPEKLIKIAQQVRLEGGRGLLVGGCVRDRLMGSEPKDWDLEVYGIDASRLREILDQLGPVNVVGESFAIYKLDRDLDVSIPRRERKSGRGHRGFVIDGDPFLSIEEASRRRDFTINAILEDPITGEIMDPFGGRIDLSKRTLRAVSKDTFIEDSLRVLRAAQFAARFDFEIDPDTVELCQGIDLGDLPAERIWGEIEKLLIRSMQPSVGIEWLTKLRVVEQLFPEIKALMNVPQDEEWHPEGDVYVHTKLVVDRARESLDHLGYPKQITVMLAALAHDFGKPATTKFLDGRWRSRGHEEAGVGPTLSFLDRLNVHSISGYDVRNQVVALVREHLKPGEFYKKRHEVGDGAFRRLARRCELELLYRVAKADSLGRNADWVPRDKWYDSAAQDWFIARAYELEVEREPPKPLLMGRHLLELGVAPGQQMGAITKAVYEMQLDGRVRDLEEAQAAAREMLSQASEEN